MDLNENLVIKEEEQKKECSFSQSLKSDQKNDDLDIKKKADA